MCIFILTRSLNWFLVLWKQLIQKQGGKITDALDLSSLAKISDGYTPGHMVRVIQSVVTKHRICQQAKRPLTAAEFVAPLAKMDPIFQQEEESFKVQHDRSPICLKTGFLFDVVDFFCDTIRTGTQRHPWEGGELELLQEKKRRLLKTKLRRIAKNRNTKLCWCFKIMVVLVLNCCTFYLFF